MRMKVEDARGVADLHRPKHLQRPLARLGLGNFFMRAQRLDDLAADGHHRVERIFRILQDHGDAITTQRPALAGRRGEQFDAVEAELLR